jgi:hypothetical protein
MPKGVGTLMFKGRKLGDWSWCEHCGRCYQVGEYREVRGLRMCPYPGCNGDTLFDATPWIAVRFGSLLDPVSIIPTFEIVPERLSASSSDNIGGLLKLDGDAVVTVVGGTGQPHVLIGDSKCGTATRTLLRHLCLFHR